MSEKKVGKIDTKKALLEAQKQGYKIPLKNGATAQFFLPNSPKIQRALKKVFESMSNEMRATTSILEVPAGERRVYLFYTPILIHHQLIQEMERMKTHIEQNLSSIVYDGHIYVPTERAGQILLNAVEKNVAPNLIALIDQK